MIALASLPTNNRIGAAWLLGSVAGATVMTVSVRLLTPDLHSSMLAFLRTFFGLALLLPLLWPAARQRAPIAFTAWKLHLLRGVLVSVALNAGFYSLWHLPLATATVLFFMAPVYATILAGPLLGEVVGIRRWSAICAAALGSLIVLRPGVDDFDPVMLLALLSSVAFATTLLLGKIAAAADGADAVFISSSVITTVTTLPPALLVWSLPESTVQWSILAILVLGSGLRNYADIRAYAVGEAGFLAPITYLRLITVGLAGYLIFGERLDIWTVVGGTIIVGATLYIALREARLGGGRGGGAP